MNTIGPVLSGQFSKNLPRWVGGIVIFCGLLVIFSWYEHWQHFLALVPGTAPMQFNTALCFILAATAFCLATIRTRGITHWLAAAVVVVGIMTLMEYVSGQAFGIDCLFYQPYFEAATEYPGRMSPLAAFCFTLLGFAIIFCRNRPELSALLLCIVGVIASVALIGFIFGIQSAYGWGAYSSMAVNTAIMFLLSSSGVFMMAWEGARLQNQDFVRWLPATASVTLMVMVVFVAIGDVKGLRSATFWREHTIQTILAAQSFENGLIDAQRSTRGYITSGDTNNLAAFKKASETVPQQLDGLIDLTKDNPEQQQALTGINIAIGKLFAYNHRLIELYQEQGTDGALKFDARGEGRAIFGNAYELLKGFSQTEQQLLDLRDTSEQTGYRNTERLLVVGSILAAILLLAANVMASRELAKRRLAEAKLGIQAEALSRSNAELAQFAYVASHDMREPLRTVSGFAQILKRRCQAKLDKDEQMNIERIVDGAKRMGNIIDDLLALSSIGSQKKIFEKLPLEQPLQMALDSLSAAVNERKAVVNHEPLPTLPVDSSQLALVFQNLIGNAIKFCRDRTPAIHIGASRENGGFWKVSVRDNGIGIEPKYFEKIFGVFQRLHSSEEYPGTGIGLAICKKIVERHGGRIWLESEPGNGTTFYFTLAEQQQLKQDA